MSDSNLSYLAEEKMRAWATQIEARPPAQTGKQKEAEVCPYLTVSREVGSGGSELARLVADQLGWDLLDHELLDHMAEHYDIPRDLLEFVDCHSPNWLVEIFGKWFDQHIVTQSEYIAKLARFVFLAARSRSTVFVGRGCHLLLPSHLGVAVFVAAPFEQRINRVAARQNCGREDAVRHIRRIDKDRQAFYDCHFHKQIGELHQYDISLNLAKFDVQVTANWLALYVREGFLKNKSDK